MKSQTLPVKRRPVPQGIFRRLSAVTRNRKQRVAATATAADFETDDGGSKISRALVIIFLIHIVAIALIFVHQRFLNGRTPNAENATPPSGSIATAQPRTDLPRLSSGETPYVVQPGDNYPRIAAAKGVDENDLRTINKHVDIGPGLILKLPPKRIVAEEPPEVAVIRGQTPSDDQRGLVEAVPVNNTTGIPKAKPVTANHSSNNEAATSKGGRSYVVQSGDTIWRIANKYKVSEDALKSANGIRDARKMKVGMKLVIPGD